MRDPPPHPALPPPRAQVLSAGLRVGFVTGPPAIVDALLLHNQASIMHTSGLAQVGSGVGEWGGRKPYDAWLGQVAVLALLRHWRVGELGEGSGAPLAGTGLETHLEVRKGEGSDE